MAGEIFISYRRADAAWARLLHSQLRAEGVEAWYDAHVGAGEDWRVATAKALEASRIFVLLFSSNAAESSDIAKELAAATLEKKLIIPVRLENIAPKGAFLYELASRNWINAYEDTEAKLAELAKGLAHLVKTGVRDESLLPFERTVPARKRYFRPVLIAAAAIAVIAVPAIATWLLWPAPRWTVESSRPFISTLALEGEPSFSLDGKILAYTSGADPRSRKIYVRNVAGGDGIKVTSDAYSDVSPTWSTDGTRIAYVATKPGEPCRIMVTGVPSGEAREVGRCSHAESTSVSWRPGTGFLYYFDQSSLIENGRLETDVIMRLDLDSGERLTLPKKSTNPILGMRHLQCSPDGKSLLLVGRENALTDVLLVRDLASGEERLLGKIIISGSATWSEDSRTVLAAMGSGIGSEITAYPVSGGAPYHVYSAAINVSHLATGVGGLLALETDPSRQNLARASKTPATQPDIIDSANGRSWAPTFAPDGTLAFLSNRSGTNAIWVMRPGMAPTMLYDAGLSPMFRLEYSPDGTRLAAPVAGQDGVSVNILTAGGGKVTSFHSPTLGGGAPTWTPDSREVVIFDKDVPAYVGVDIANTAHRRPVVPSPWGAVLFHNNAIFAARFDKPGYWQFDKAPRLVTGKYPMRWDPPPTLQGDELLIPQFDAPEGPRILAQPLAGGPDRVLAYAPGAQAQEGALMSKMAVNPKTGEIIYVAAVQSDTNIDLLTMARH
jgi:Tol biopolymer transport system component